MKHPRVPSNRLCDSPSTSSPQRPLLWSLGLYPRLTAGPSGLGLMLFAWSWEETKRGQTLSGMGPPICMAASWETGPEHRGCHEGPL